MIIPEKGSAEYYASLLLDGETLQCTTEQDEYVYYAILTLIDNKRRVTVFDDAWDEHDSMSYTRFITSIDFKNWFNTK